MYTGNHRRKSTLDFQELYFWTATIHNWENLLMNDALKMEIINALKYLKHRKLITLYAFVIMPNHIHLIWSISGNNRKESPMASLLKFTAHQYKQYLKLYAPGRLPDYYVGTREKNYEFWQRDPLAIPLFTRAVILQKLDYIHRNPVSKRWALVEHYDDYRFSSAKYYNGGEDEFELLTNIQTIL